MSMNNIHERYQALSEELKDALATMEYSERVKTIRHELNDLQNMCPHYDGQTNFSDQPCCPYCGKKFRK